MKHAFIVIKKKDKVILNIKNTMQVKIYSDVCELNIYIIFNKLSYLIQAKGIWKQDPEANIWAQEG